MKKHLLLALLLLPSSLLFAVDDEIHIDQLGYRPMDAKFAVIALDRVENFRVMDASTGKAVFMGKTDNRVNDRDSGDKCYRADFSELRKEGEYYIEVDREFKSYNFTIGQSVYNDAFIKAMGGFYLQRCGMEVGNKEGGWGHKACHLKASMYHKDTGAHETERRDVSGGWHDAGDYGRYTVNSGIATGTLLLMYERYADKLESLELKYKYSGRMPDTLEEIKYNLDWMLKMQENNGGVYHKATTWNFPQMDVMPENDPLEGFVYRISSAATADFAAVMAIAGRAYKHRDRAYAAKCLEAARRAWNWLKDNPGIVPDGGFKNPQDCQTGEYGDDNDADERFWAAVELFNTTEEEDFADYINENFGKWDPLVEGGAWWRDVHTLAMQSYAYSKAPSKDRKLDKKIRTDVKRAADVIVAHIGESGYRTLIPEEMYIWGSNSVVLNYAITLLAAADYTGEKSYIQGAAEALHYIFGRNPFNMSFVTGTGDYPVENIHHRPSNADGITAPYPGLLSGGPNGKRQDSVLQGLSFETPPMKCWEDNVRSYAGNEIAINWNAPLCYVLAYFYEK
ncbi:MAG: glycoside hydrolase family 9 protein [Spirochaetia bacterium]|nr:glycoside hydrolase family 9 protein [Spirochaetia bacterium]